MAGPGTNERKLRFIFEAGISGTVTEAITAIAAGLDKLAGKIDYTRKSLQNQMKTLNESVSGLQGLGNAANEASNHMSKLERAFGTIINYGGAAGVIYAVTNSMKMGTTAAIGYDQALANVKAITSATESQTAQMGESFKKVAHDTKFSMIEIAKGAETIAQAGFNAADTAKIIGPVAQLAQATLGDIATSANLLTTVLNVFGMEANRASEAADVLAAAVNHSKLTIDKLNVAMNYVGPIAANAKMSLQETAAAMMLLSNSGLRASTIGTSMRQVLMALLKPTADLVGLMHEHGMTLYDVNMKTMKFEEVLKNLNKAIKDPADAFSVFGTRGAGAALILAKATTEFQLANGKMTSAYKMMLDDASEFGSVTRMTETTMKGLGDTLSNAIGRLQLFAIALMEGSIAFEFFAAAAKSIGYVADKLVELLTIPFVGPFIQTMTILIATIAAANVVLPLLVAGVGMLSVSFGALTTGAALSSIVAFLRTFIASLLVATPAAVAASVSTLTLSGSMYTLAASVTTLGNAVLAFFLKMPALLAVIVAFAAGYALYKSVLSDSSQTEALGKEREGLEKHIDALENYSRALRNTEQGSGTHAKVISEASSKYKDLSKALFDNAHDMQAQIVAMDAYSEKYKTAIIANLEKEIELIAKKKKAAQADLEVAKKPGMFDSSPDYSGVAKAQESIGSYTDEMAKKLAQEAELQAKSNQTAMQMVPILAKRWDIEEGIVKSALMLVEAKRKLKEIEGEKITQDDTDDVKTEKLSKRIKELTPAMQEYFAELKKSDAPKFWEFATQMLEKHGVATKKVTEAYAIMSKEDAQAAEKIIMQRYRDEVSFDAYAKHKRLSVKEELDDIDAKIAIQMDLRERDRAHAEVYNVNIANLHEKSSTIRLKLEKELYAEMQRLRKEDSAQYSDDFVQKANTMLEGIRRQNEQDKNTVQAKIRAAAAERTRQDHADQKMDAERASNEVRKIEHNVSMWKEGEEEIAWAKEAIQQESLGRQIKKQQEIVNRMKGTKDSAYRQELEALESLENKQTQIAEEYIVKRRDAKVRGINVATSAELQANTTLQYLADKNILNDEQRMTILGMLQIEYNQIVLEGLKKVHELRKDDTSYDYATKAIEIKKQELEIDKQILEEARKLAAFRWSTAREELGRGEITTNEYMDRLKKAEDAKAITSRKAEEEKVTQAGTTLERIGLGIKRFQDKVKTSGEILVESTTQLAEGMADAFGEAFASTITGTESFMSAFRKLANSVIMDLTKMIAKQMIYNSLAGVVGGVSSWIGGLFSSTKTSSASVSSYDGMQVHGGNINPTGHQVRAGLRMFHSGGIAEDEYYALLKRGETVRTAAQEAALQGSSAANLVFQMNVTNKKEDAVVTTSKPRFDGARWVADMLVEAKGRGMV